MKPFRPRHYRLDKARTWAKEWCPSRRMLYRMCWTTADDRFEFGMMVDEFMTRDHIAWRLRDGRRAMRDEVRKRQKVRSLGRQILERCTTR